MWLVVLTNPIEKPGLEEDPVSEVDYVKRTARAKRSFAPQRGTRRSNVSSFHSEVDGRATRIQIWKWYTLGEFISKDKSSGTAFRVFGLIVVVALKQVGEEPARETP